jgi:hypothetical protein
MAYLAVVASQSVNGVAAIHSEIIKDTIFKDFYEMYPERFNNKTNGVTQRRWLAFCNPRLRDLITSALGSQAWIKDLSQLQVGARGDSCGPRMQVHPSLAQSLAAPVAASSGWLQFPYRGSPQWLQACASLGEHYVCTPSQARGHHSAMPVSCASPCQP